MRRLFVAIALLAAWPAAAQITIDTTPTLDPGRLSTTAAARQQIPTSTYFSPAADRARRDSIRHARNTIDYGVGLMGTVTSLSDSWIKTSGGDNSIGIASTFWIYHTYKKDKFSLLSKFDGKFGYNRIVVERVENGNTSRIPTWYKYQDEFVLSTSPAYAISRDWALASILRFRSQFANGFVSRAEQASKDLKSCFMAPGFLDISAGFTYVSPDKRWPFRVNISPIALSATYVHSAAVRTNTFNGKQGWENYGLINPRQRSKYEGGSSVQVDFDRTFGERGTFRYRTTLYSFMGWISNVASKTKISDYKEYQQAVQDWTAGGKKEDKPMLSVHPTVRWEHTLDIKATKYLTTSLYFQLYYNRAQHLALQTQLLLSVGVTYTFKNK